MDRFAPIVDCHTHTAFSDGTSTFEENARAAAASGCRVLVAADHLTLPASLDPAGEASVLERDLPRHRAAFDAARELARGLGVEYVLGFECDWYEGCEPLVERWSAGAVVRLGSVHWIGGPGDIAAGAGDPGSADDPALRVAPAAGGASGWIDSSEDLGVWEELGPDGVWERYVETWCRACESPLAFDVMAHPDLPMRFRREGLAAARDLGSLFDEMATCAHDTGRRVEVSTAGLRKGTGDLYPSSPLLARFQRAGVPVTFSTDAHAARDVHRGLDEAARRAYDAGYRSYDVPHADGDWETIPLG